MAGPSTTQTQSNNSEDNIANQNQQPTDNSADNVTERAVADDTQSSRPGAYRVGGGNNNDASANTNIAEQRQDGSSQLTDEQVGEVLGNLGITCVDDAVAVPILDTDCEAVDAIDSPDREVADATTDCDVVVDGIPMADEVERRRKLKLIIISIPISIALIGAIILAVFFGVSKNSNGDEGEDIATVEDDIAKVEVEAEYYSSISQIRKEKVLRCGVAALRGFGGLLNEDTGEYEGMCADLCKAVAASILGDQYEIDIIHVNAATRFTALASRDIDLLIQGDTHTMERDFHEPTTGAGYQFTDPFIYSGLGFGGIPKFIQCVDSFHDCKSTGSCSSISDCDDLKICTYATSHHVLILEDIFPSTNLVPITIKENDDEFYQNFIDGNCNVLAGEGLSISEVIVRALGYTDDGDYAYSENVLSKEPLGMVTRKKDKLGLAVNLVLRTLIHAEAANMTKANADELIIGDTPTILDLVSAIKAAGNYGDIYERNMELWLPRKGLNLLYSASDDNESGLHYSHPTGETNYFRHEFAADSTINQILERGSLICGVIGNEEQSMETDYCRALSASLFSGDPNLVDIVKLNYDEVNDLATTLASGEVDVIAGASVVAAPLYPGIVFTEPYYFDGSSPPKAMATRGENDSDWNSFVYWVCTSLIKAEEEGITSTNFGDKIPDIRFFGPDFEWMFRGPIIAVGNYGEIYERNQDTLIPRANSKNLLNNGGPLLTDKL